MILLVVALLSFGYQWGLTQAQQVTATINSVSPIYRPLNPSLNTTLSCTARGADTVEWLVDNTYAKNEIIANRGITQSVVTTMNAEKREFRRDIVIPNTVANVKTVVVCVAELFLSPNDTRSLSVELNLVSSATTQPPATVTGSTIDNTKRTSENPVGSDGIEPKPLHKNAIIAIVVTIVFVVLLSGAAAIVGVIFLIRKTRKKREGMEKMPKPESDDGKIGKGGDSSVQVGRERLSSA